MRERRQVLPTVAILDGESTVELLEKQDGDTHARRVVIHFPPSAARVSRQLGNLQILFNAVAMANGGHLLVDSANP